MSNIEHEPDYGPVHRESARLESEASWQRAAELLETERVVAVEQLRGAVEDFREIDRLLVQATIELPSERAVTVERAIAIARGHLGAVSEFLGRAESLGGQ